jgi:hypothetical protein
MDSQLDIKRFIFAFALEYNALGRRSKKEGK